MLKPVNVDYSFYMKVVLLKLWLWLLMVCVFNSSIVSGQISLKSPSIVFTNSGEHTSGSCSVVDIPRPPDTLEISTIYFPAFLIVKYRCKDSYMLTGDDENVCLKGKWTLPPSYHPKCIKYCSKLPFPDISLNGKCDIDGETISCHGLVKSKAIAHISCSFGYREPDEGFVGFIRCNEKGEWDAPMRRCEQICAHEEHDSSTPTSNEAVPWYVGVFGRYRTVFGTYFSHFVHKCGGTIVNAKIVITAAHCFTDGFFKETNLYDPSEVRIVAGNYSRDYEIRQHIDISTLTTQILKVAKIIHNDNNMNPTGYYASNFVLLVLLENIIFTPTIKPVCLEVDYNSTQQSVETGLIGKAAAWDSKDKLMFIMTTFERNECVHILHSESEYIDTDKFCAVNGNGYKLDQGTGLVLPKTIGEKTFYFLRGVSTANSSCTEIPWFTDIRSYTDVSTTNSKCTDIIWFADIRSYTDFILEYINETIDATDSMKKLNDNLQIHPTAEESTVEEGSCLIPADLSETLQFYYAAQPDREIPKGSFVDPFVDIIYKCEETYTIVGSNSENICLNGTWNDPNHPECIRLCPPLYLSGITTSAICEIDGMTVTCLTPLKPNSIARLTCSVGYRKAADSFYDVLRCGDDGEWDYQPFKCEPICGIEAPEAKTYIIGGEISNITKVPWHVGIYSDIYNEGRFRQICGGTILNAKVVISAAHCFWNNRENQFHNESNFKVAAGKYYRDFYATEPIESQIVNVSHIYHKSEYSDYAGLYAFDIALLIVEDHIVFKSYTKPICMETLLYNEKNVAPGLIGRVAGWGLESRGGKSSAELKIIDLPAIEYHECREKFSLDYRPFITPDKFCAGFTDGQSVCEGDSGGGLAFAKIIGGTAVYYLRGIVSSGDNRAGSCDNEKYTVFTNIQYHIEMITFIESTNRPK